LQALRAGRAAGERAESAKPYTNTLAAARPRKRASASANRPATMQPPKYYPVIMRRWPDTLPRRMYQMASGNITATVTVSRWIGV
jgi:hypothetical protein